LCVCVCVRVCLAILSGTGVVVGSRSSVGLNGFLYGLSMCFTGLVIITQPHRNFRVHLVMCAVCALEVRSHNAKDKRNKSHLAKSQAPNHGAHAVHEQELHVYTHTQT
jgi:hypothetical protein